MSKEFPDIAFVNVDGQAVPFTKPQHYKKGSTTDTLLTGEDNPLPTKDESVEARLQAIEQTQSQILDKLNDTIDTRLTGSIVEEIIFERDIRNDGTGVVTKIRPQNAIGLFLEHRVYGLTGTFERDEGHSVLAYPYISSPGRILIGDYENYMTKPSSQRSSNNHSFSVSLLPHKIDEDAYNLSKVKPPVYKNVRLQIYISGTFDDGEGVDSELIAHWIMK